MATWPALPRMGGDEEMVRAILAELPEMTREELEEMITAMAGSARAGILTREDAIRLAASGLGVALGAGGGG